MIVLDASVVLKWYFHEEAGSDQASAILERHQGGDETIAVPDLLPYEVGNVLNSDKAFTDAAASEALLNLFSLHLLCTAFSPEDHTATLETARRYRLSVYDASYVHLAQKLKCDFITADQKLFEKTKSLSFVRCL